MLIHITHRPFIIEIILFLSMIIFLMKNKIRHTYYNKLVYTLYTKCIYFLMNDIADIGNAKNV